MFFIILVVYLLDLLTSLITVHDRHIQIEEDGIIVIRLLLLFLIVILVLGLIPELVELQHVFLNGSHRFIAVDSSAHVDVLFEGLYHIHHYHQLERLIIDHKQFGLLHTGQRDFVA